MYNNFSIPTLITPVLRGRDNTAGTIHSIDYTEVIPLPHRILEITGT